MPMLKSNFLKPQSTISDSQQKETRQGFIVLEALIAMSLIVGVWVAMVQIYQGLALRQIQLQTEKVQIRKESDVFEFSEYARPHHQGSIENESTRVLGRSRPMSNTTQPIIKNKRRFGN
jgi:hypothetical protein